MGDFERVHVDNRYICPNWIHREGSGNFKDSWYSIIIIIIIIILDRDKVAQLVRCRTSNHRVAGSIPVHSGHFGRSWAKQFIPYCFSLPSCKMGT